MVTDAGDRHLGCAEFARLHALRMAGVFVVWLGWALDATDFNLFSLVLKPAVTEILGGTGSPADIGKWGGLLAMVGLLGWALGGMLFGVVADMIGRVRTLIISIVLVAVFTAGQGLSQNILQF